MTPQTQTDDITAMWNAQE